VAAALIEPAGDAKTRSGYYIIVPYVTSEVTSLLFIGDHVFRE
jgi:hypothetical protein